MLFCKNTYQIFVLNLFLFLASLSLCSQVQLEKEVKITDSGLHFNGNFESNRNVSDNGNSDSYSYVFGRNISAHGDAVKAYGNYVFMTWYRGGKLDRHMMLSRYNTVTGTLATIEFPHTHTGFQNRWWLGESHNTIAVGISPLDGTIHLLYDMHAYSPTKPSNGSLANDYFRYSYSVKDAATLPDSEFTLDKFVKDNGVEGDYKHLRTPGNVNQREFLALTYPRFFLNDQGDLLFFMREGGNNNGMYKFSKYDANKGEWQNFTDFNRLNAKSQAGITFNWGLYGDIKYVNGKIRIGFQRRSSNNNDKFLFQNGVYYAYSDDPSGATQWKDHRGEAISLPLLDADDIKIMEPGDYVETTKTGRVRIVGGFDWTVTANEDVHIISQVRDLDNNVTKNLHTYKPSGASEFITSEDFSGGAALYTAGDDIFLIGLSGGRVFIEKADGGTNNFTKVYQATGGKRFDHGVVYIKEGKVYYYLMEDKSGSAQPLYLQIIDLNIDTSPFRVSLKTPIQGDVFGLDKTIEIAANAFKSEGTISKVVFTVNDLVIDEDLSEPYSTSWKTTEEGTFKIKAIAYDENDNTKSSSERTVTVRIKDPLDLSGEFYRLKNVETGTYLKASSSESSLSLSNFQDTDDLKFQFVSTTLNGKVYYSIDPKIQGVLRATGANFSTKYAVVTSGREPPNADVDKVWTAHFDEKDNTYRFEARDSGRFLYSELNESLSNNLAEDDDNRSKWILESGVLSVKDNNLVLPSINVFPNPASKHFTIALKGFTSGKIIINDVLGKTVYSNILVKENTVIKLDQNFTSGLYLLKIVDSFNKVYHKKLVIK